MEIIFGTAVDLITPFPPAEVKRIWSWMQAYRSIVFHDDSPDTPQAYETIANELNGAHLMYGIIDKENRTGSRVDAPIVGMVAFQPAGAHNYYVHVACTRKVGKSYKLYGVSLVDEAVQLALEDVFNRWDRLQRISAVVLDTNFPVLGLAKRIGFRREATLPAWFTQSGEPKTAIHLGYLRPGAATEPAESIDEPIEAVAEEN